MNIHIDYTQFANYTKAFGRFKSQWNSFLRAYLKELALIAMRKAMKRTPVDTGRLRRSWKLSSVTTIGSSLVITITNDAKSGGDPTSYASHVEFGHATRGRKGFVKGKYMITVSLKEVEGQAERIFNRMIIAYAKRVGVY